MRKIIYEQVYWREKISLQFSFEQFCVKSRIIDQRFIRQYNYDNSKITESLKSVVYPLAKVGRI